MPSDDNEAKNSKEVYEFLRNLLSAERSFALLHCGSAFELPIQYVIANPTDVDIMYVETGFCALPVNVGLPATHNYRGKTVIVNTEGTYPGFARLYSPDYERMHRGHSNILENHYRHGPALTTTIICPQNIKFVDLVFRNLSSSRYREILCSRLLEMEVDRVFAIYCPCWPNEADEWKTRERPNGWPPKEGIDKVVASGCYFVAKPHQSSPEDDTQWRFSFSHAEVILIHSWTDVQKYIYHILRLIKSEVVKACGESHETVLCTYFFKTLMFWECERKSKEFWEDERVETSIRELLCIMIGWLIDGCYPNYFIPQSNLIFALTERVNFTKEIQLLLNYSESCIAQITTVWPRAYSKHVIGQIQVLVPEKVILYMNLMQLRHHRLNPLYPQTYTKLMKQLTERNSLLWRKASDLNKGIRNHIQLTKTRCPIRRNYFTRETLRHFILALMETGDECSKRFLFMGESFYEFLERFNSATDCKTQSDAAHNNIRKDSSDLRMRGNCRQSQLNTSVERDQNVHGRFTRCYSRLDDVDSKVKSRPSAKLEHLNASIQTILQKLLTYWVDDTSTTTRVISATYLANFYFTALHDYSTASLLCDKVLDFWGREAIFSERAFPIFITNESSSIFDEHFQTVLGLITLHRSINESLQDSSTVLVRIRPAQFLKYLRTQCKRCDGVDEPHIRYTFEHSDDLYKWYDTYEPLSEVFMSAVMHAGRSKFA